MQAVQTMICDLRFLTFDRLTREEFVPVMMEMPAADGWISDFLFHTDGNYHGIVVHDLYVYRDHPEVSPHAVLLMELLD